MKCITDFLFPNNSFPKNCVIAKKFTLKINALFSEAIPTSTTTAIIPPLCRGQGDLHFKIQRTLFT